MADTKFQRAEKFLPSLYRIGNNKMVTAFVRGWTDQDQDIVTNIAELKKQMFVATASPPYLDMLGSGVGVKRPTILPVGNEEYRQYVLHASYDPKTVRLLIYKILDIFWGIDKTHSNVNAVDETYDFSAAPLYLTVKIDGGDERSIEFLASDFVTPASATAEEVDTKINATIGDVATARPWPNEALTPHVQLYTNTPGLSGSVEVTGGTANAILQFPTKKAQHVDVTIVEINPGEIIITIPDLMIITSSLIGTHHFHPNADIIDSRPVIDSAHPFWPGSFFYDHSGPGMHTVGYSNTYTTCETTANISAGTVISNISVDTSLQFPNTTGQVMFGWGTSDMEKVNYTGRPSPMSLGIDPHHTFLHDWPSGSLVWLLEPEWDPRPYPNYDYPIYFIDTQVSEDLIRELMDIIKAAGVVLHLDITKTIYLYNGVIV